MTPQFLKESVTHSFYHHQGSVLVCICVTQMVNPSPCVQVTIPLLPNKKITIQWLIWTMEWRDIFLPVLCHIVFYIIQSWNQCYATPNLINYILLLLNFLAFVRRNVTSSLIGTKLFDEFFLWPVNVFIYAVFFNSTLYMG